MNKKSIPLIQAQQIELIRNKLSKISKENRDIIEVIQSNDIIKIKDIDPLSVFVFRVFESKTIQNSPSFNFEYAPKDKYSGQNMGIFAGSHNNVLEHFNTWLGLLTEYNKVSLSSEEEFLKVYQNEFYNDFILIEEDANSMPYDDNTQRLIFSFADYIEKKLLESKLKNIEELIDDTKEIKESITKSTKSEVVRKISKLLAKTKIKVPKLFFEIIDVAKKELIKSVLKSGVKQLPTIVEEIQKFIG